MAINKAQFTILEKIPFLFTRQILSLVTKHNTYLMNKGFINYRPYTELEDIFMNLDKKSINNVINIIINKKYDIYIDEYSPKEMFYYPVLINYILSKEISYIEYLPEDIITDEHIKLLAKKENTILYLINKDKLPLKALNNQEILNVALKEASVEKYFYLLELIDSNYPNNLSNALDIGIVRGIFEKYHPYMEKYLTNEKVIKALNRIDIHDIFTIYKTNPALAYKVFTILIKENKVVGIYSKKDSEYLSFFDNSDILHMLAESTNLIELDSFLEQIDVINFSIKDLVNIIINLDNNLYAKYPKNFFNNYLCLKLSIENKKSNCFIGFNPELVKRYLLETNSFLELNDNFDSLLYYLSKSDFIPIDNKKLLADYLYCLNNKHFKKIEYFSIFTLSSYTKENVENFIKFINSYPGTFTIPEQLINDRVLFNELLEKCDDPAVIIQMNIQDLEPKEINVIISKIKDRTSRYFVMSKAFSNNSLFLTKLLENSITNPDLIKLINPDLFTKETINDIYNKKELRIFQEIDTIPIDSISKQIQIDENSVNDLLTLPDNEDTLVRCLITLSKVNNSNNSLDGIEIKSKNILLRKGLPEKEVNLYIHEIKKGTKDPLSALYINSRKNLLFALYITDYFYDYNSEYIDSIPITILERVNSNHLRDIINILKEYTKEYIRLAMNIYLSIGYERSMNLLSSDPKKNYGNVDIKKIKKIFNDIDINNVVMIKEGHGYVPELNEEWIELIFGKNNKVRNTPIKNYLNDYTEKKEEIAYNNIAINNNEELDEEEKRKRMRKNELLQEKYIQNNEYLMSKASEIFNNWLVIKEEFLKSSNVSKLKVKMNTNRIIEILNSFNALKKINCDYIEDEELLNTDVFDYVGKDNQFATHTYYIPSRILELSRAMNSIRTKKFPNIRVCNDSYTLKTYNPQDRRILSAGYRTGCCFRPNGDADNPTNEYKDSFSTTNGHSKDSLLRYCCNTEYGGCIELCDNADKTIIAAPILRSGNVLIIHSLETKEELISSYYELLIDYANKVLEESYKNNDNIDFVILGESNKIDKSFFRGQLPFKSKFKYYNVNDEYPHMYNNFDLKDQLVLAVKKGKKVEDIHYGKVDYSYSYPINYYEHSCVIDNILLFMCLELEKLSNQYIELANKRFIAEEQGNERSSYELLVQIRKVRKQYLHKYNELLKKKKGMDYYKNIKTLISIISSIRQKVTIKDLMLYDEIYYGKDWYVAITNDKEIICDCKPSGKEPMHNKLEELKI